MLEQHICYLHIISIKMQVLQNLTHCPCLEEEEI